MHRILALETTTMFGSVAACEDARLVHEIAPQRRSAQSLVPAVKELLDAIGWKIGEVDCIAVSIGPGSFTGLRVGVATAKMLAYALGAKLVGVDTLSVIATLAMRSHYFRAENGSEFTPIKRISAAVDAQRGEIVAQNFELTPPIPVPTGPQQVIPGDAWYDFGRGEGTLFTGPVLKRFAAKMPPNTHFVEESFWSPHASAVAEVAFPRILAEDFDDFWTLLPKYFRPSAAEEKANLGK